MSDYTKATNFTSKDSLSTGNPLKIVKGTEIDTEFNNIQTAIATKADLNSPTFSGTVTIVGGTITGITDLAVADGGTGASTASGARTNLSAASSGANSDITSITGLTTPLTVAQGGIGAATLTANNVLLGNGTNAPQTVAPGTSGNVLVSNGTTWTSTTPSYGSVTSVATGNGLTGGTITTSGTISLDIYNGTTANYSSYAIGSYVLVGTSSGGSTYPVNTAQTVWSPGSSCPTTKAQFAFSNQGGASVLSGTWKSRGYSQGGCSGNSILFTRTA